MKTTKTGDDILKYLKAEGFILNPKNQDYIQNTIRDATKSSFDEGVQDGIAQEARFRDNREE